MRMTLKVGSGITDYLSSLDKLLFASNETIEKAVRVGGGIVTDEIRKNLEKIPTDESYGSAQNKKQGIKKIEKKGLLESLGIAPIQDSNGMINVKAGFDGYNEVKTKKYPKGCPNAMIARSVESGTSFMQKTPFVSTAVRAVKDKAERAMAEVIDSDISRIVK